VYARGRPRKPAPSASRTLLSQRKPSSDVLSAAMRIELHRSGPATYIEGSLRSCLHALPLEEHGLRTALTGHETDRLAIDNLSLWIDTRASPVPESVAYDLS